MACLYCTFLYQGNVLIECPSGQVFLIKVLLHIFKAALTVPSLRPTMGISSSFFKNTSKLIHKCVITKKLKHHSNPCNYSSMDVDKL